MNLFGLLSTIRYRKKNTLDIVINGKNFVEFLLKCGLRRGNKILNQIDIPNWIFMKKEFIRGCLRGLVDTDGGIYFHMYTTNGIKYRHIGLCFTSYSLPLLSSAEKMFLTLGLNVKNEKRGKHLFLYGKKEAGRYLGLVGTSNPKPLTRFKSYKGSKP